MKRLIVDDRARVGAWVAEKVGRESSWGDFQALGLEEDGVLIAGIVVEGYVKDARCVAHVAGEGKRWLNKEFLFACFDYMFRVMGCKVVLGLVDADNEAALRFDTHLGFSEIFRLKDGAGDCDLVILEMRKENCRWLKTEAR